MVLAIALAFALILTGHKPVAKGLVLGALFSIVNFVLIAETIPLRIGRSRGRTLAVSLGSMAVRYALMAVPLIVAVRSPAFSLPAAAAGLFMVQLVILADNLPGGAGRSPSGQF